MREHALDALLVAALVAIALIALGVRCDDGGPGDGGVRVTSNSFVSPSRD